MSAACSSEVGGGSCLGGSSAAGGAATTRVLVRSRRSLERVARLRADAHGLEIFEGAVVQPLGELDGVDVIGDLLIGIARADLGIGAGFNELDQLVDGKSLSRNLR